MKSAKEAREALLNIAKEIFEDSSDIEVMLDMDLKKQGFNSFNFIKLVIAIEEQFDFEFDDDDLDFDNFKTLKDVMEYMIKKNICEDEQF